MNNCPNKDCWLDTVVDGRCSVCGCVEPPENTEDMHTISDNGQEKPIITDERNMNEYMEIRN